MAAMIINAYDAFRHTGASEKDVRKMTEALSQSDGTMDQRFAQIDRRFDALEQRMESGFTALQQRLESRFTLLNRLFGVNAAIMLIVLGKLLLMQSRASQRKACGRSGRWPTG
jgi:hypothetical protein